MSRSAEATEVSHGAFLPEQGVKSLEIGQVSGLKVAQSPDAPTTSPLSLIPKATPSGSPRNVGSLDLVTFPSNRFKVEHLGSWAGLVRRGVLCGADRYALTVHHVGLAVAAS
jgi:hypothetical protein